MPSIPIWGVAILITSVICIISCLLYNLFRCRRHVARSTIDPAEYLDKKHGTCTLDTKSSINPASISIQPSNSQLPIPSTTRSLPNHQIQSPSPETFSLSNEMELGSVDASHRVSLSRSNSTSKSSTPNHHNATPIDLSATYNTVSEKATSTIKNIFRRQKSHTNKLSARQLFDLSTNQSYANNASDADSATSLSLSQPLPLPPPPPLPPKDDLPLPSPTPFVQPPPSQKRNNHCNFSPHHEDKPIPSSNPPHQLNDETNQQDIKACLPLSLLDTNVNNTILDEPESHQVLVHNLDSMFAWSTSDDDDDDDDVDNTSNHHSIGPILHKNDNNADIKSVTSGSVHRLVRDSTVLDGDHRSLAARSVASSARLSLHDMESWWSIQDNSTDQPTPESFGTICPLPRVQDPLHLSSHPDVPTGESSNNCCPSSNAVDNSSTPSSTYSHHSLNTFRLTLSNEDQDQGQEPETTPESAAMEQNPQAAYQSSSTEPLDTNTPDNELSPVSSTTKESKSTTKTTLIPTSNSTMSKQTNSKKKITSIPARVKPLQSIRPNVRSNTTIGTSSGSKVDSVRRELQSPWYTHRLSDKSTMARGSSIRSSPVPSPNNSVNPRQLNQHLVSISFQGNKQQQQQQHRPSLPNGFINEEWLIQRASIEDNPPPQPTVSFSSSTVRTMIPENEFHIGKKETLILSQQKQQTPIKQAPTTLEQKQHQLQSTKKAAPSATLDQDQEQEPSFDIGTVRAHRQQRGAIPWSSNSFRNNKTPAQRERDRYLQLNE